MTADSAPPITHFRATLDGEEYEIEYQPGQVLLDCLIDADLDPPFQCQQGHCGTCMAVRISGEVEMRQNNVLSKRDLKQGYVLLCQSEPRSNDVWVDCDA
jgi:ferredoxin